MRTQVAIVGAGPAGLLLGRLLRQTESPVRIGLVTLVGSLQFFLVSNFGVWLLYDMYPKTWEGLVTCYLAALPFYGHEAVARFEFLMATVTSDLLFVALLFGAHALLARRWFPAEQPLAERRVLS